MTSEGDGGLIDWPALVAQFRGKESSALRVAATALRSQEPVPGTLRSLAAAADYPALALAAHSIKGMAGNLKADALYETAKLTDELARLADPQAREQAEALARLMERLLQELRERLDAAGPTV
jgi:HPt (histidine-containing phosphotransfer) domain-containing protein